MAKVLKLDWGGCVWGLLFIIFGNRGMLFCIIPRLKQKNLLWIVLDGKFVQSWWLMSNSSISIIA